MPDPLMDYQIGATANWEVDLWHKLSSSKRAAVEHYLATVEGRNAVLSSLISQVAANYYHLLALDNKLDLIHQYIDLQKKAVEIAKIQKSADADTELAVEKFASELAKARSEEYTLRQEMTETENNLNLLLGRYPTDIKCDKTAFLSTNLQEVTTGLPSELLQNRPDIRQAEHELTAARWNVDAARKEFLPSLNISATLGLDAFNPTLSHPSAQVVGIQRARRSHGSAHQPQAIRQLPDGGCPAGRRRCMNTTRRLLTAYSEVCTLMSKIKNLGQYYQLKAEDRRRSNILSMSLGSYT